MDENVNVEVFEQDPVADSEQYDAAKELLAVAERGYGSPSARDRIAAANVHALLALRDALLFLNL